jgi:murein DD-endopeptidase MepM/ murein hydrolase activator NlpD
VPSVTVGEVAGAPIVIPVAGIRAENLKDNFSDARAGHVHDALDIMAPRGTPVLAAVDGKVRKLFTSRAGGITIYETDTAEEMIYYYAHLDRYASDLTEGKVLRRGDVIGYVGTTGNAPANSPHLHFAISVLPPTKEWWKGEPINPYPILTGRGVTKSSSGLPPHPAGGD